MANENDPTMQPWVLPPDIQVDILQNQRKRAIANALLQQSMEEPNPTQTAGRYVVPFNPLQGLSQLGKAYASSRLNKQADQQQADIQGREMKYRQDLAQQVFPNDQEMQKNFMYDPQGTLKSGLEAKRSRDQAQFTSDLEVQRKANETPPEVKEYQLWKSENPKGSYTDFLRIKSPQFAFGSGGAGDQNMDATAAAIARYDLPPPSPMAMRMPNGQALMAKVLQNNPKYSAPDYNANNAIVRSYGSGKDHQTTNAFNTAIQHLGVLLPVVDAMSNGDVQAVNTARNWYQRQTGQTAPTDFGAVRGLVSDELVKAATGSAGALGDREEMRANISSSGSPAQLHSAIDRYLDLMGGKMQAHRQGYEVTGRQDFERYLTPAAAKFMKSFDARPQQTTPQASSGGGQPFSDPDKERRYQEWKAKQQ